MVGTGTVPLTGSTVPGVLGTGNGGDGGSNEIYRVEAIGNVHIYTATDHVVG